MISKEESIRLIFGLKVRHLRKSKSLSQSEVAETTGLSVSYLNEIEKGKKYPKIDKITAIAKALGVSYEWLVSLQVSQRLAPIVELLKMDLLTSLPLDIFGIELSDLIEKLSDSPTQLSAFISTLIEIARNHDMTVERFYFSVLRSYQEMHENYFEEIETEVEQFITQNEIKAVSQLTTKELQQILEEKYQYTIDEDTLQRFEHLQHLRSVVIPEKKKLYINPLLNAQQRRFTFAKEIGYLFMHLKNRTYTTSWVKIESFEQILNNFKASYFAGALLIPKDEMIKDCTSLFEQPNWNSHFFLSLTQKYQASPEMFLHRLTNIAPRFFGLSHLFFLRFRNQPHSNEYSLDKELHLAGLYNPHGSVLNQHYCRRWVSIHILQDLEQTPQEMLCKVQRSSYFDSDNEYFCISLASAAFPTPNKNSSVTIGFLMNEEFKQKAKFHHTAPLREVGVACERCSHLHCQERAAPPYLLQDTEKTAHILQNLEQLKKLG